MISYLPDVNVWLALSVGGHVHHAAAARWFESVRREDRLFFTRYSQMGFLRLLTNASVMGPSVLRVGRAWELFDRWLADSRIEFHPEPRTVDAAFRRALAPLARQAASKWIGDCYLLAFARESGATFVTFDQALSKLAGTTGYAASSRSSGPPEPGRDGSLFSLLGGCLFPMIETR